MALGTHKILNIHQQHKAFLDTTKSQFLLPLDSSPNRKSSDGRFCHTSPAKLKICSCPMQFLDFPRSFRSLHVRFWRPQANRNLRHPWVESEMPISWHLLLTLKVFDFQQNDIPWCLPTHHNLHIRQLFKGFCDASQPWFLDTKRCAKSNEILRFRNSWFQTGFYSLSERNCTLFHLELL